MENPQDKENQDKIKDGARPPELREVDDTVLPELVETSEAGATRGVESQNDSAEAQKNKIRKEALEESLRSKKLAKQKNFSYGLIIAFMILVFIIAAGPSIYVIFFGHTH